MTLPSSERQARYPPAEMLVVHLPQELRAFAHAAFVPTMGALHEGHAALVRRAREVVGRDGSVVVSVFVNPTQFAPGEDFAKYPRTLEHDVALAAAAGADALFAPTVETVYPPGAPASLSPRLPPVATEPRLEDAHRPSHFAGVCQVVARLFDLVMPSAAIFGEKDFQQLRVIESMVTHERGRWPSLRIVAHPTVREPDGLAMSSRNRYLRVEQREQALGLSRALQVAAAPRPATAEARMRATLEGVGLSIDYAVVRDAKTLMPVDTFERPTRALIAARLGLVRLIDNAAMPVWP